MTDITTTTTAAIKPTSNAEFEQQLVLAMQRVEESVIELARSWTDWLNFDARAAHAAADRYGLTRPTRTRLERIGRGHMDHRLFDIHGRVRDRMLKLPVYEQTRLLDKGVELLLCDKPGEHLVMEVAALQTEQLAQVFGFDGVRSLAEQRAYIEERKLRNITCQERKDYEIVGCRLKVNRPVELDLRDILHELPSPVLTKLLKQVR